MTSEHTAHRAVRDTGYEDHERWRVSWLPGYVGRPGAHAAMAMADVLALHGDPLPGRVDTVFEHWADELGLSAGRAVELIESGRWPV
jgi:hypothetical protein